MLFYPFLTLVCIPSIFWHFDLHICSRCVKNIYSVGLARWKILRQESLSLAALNSRGVSFGLGWRAWDRHQRLAKKETGPLNTRPAQCFLIWVTLILRNWPNKCEHIYVYSSPPYFNDLALKLRRAFKNYLAGGAKLERIRIFWSTLPTCITFFRLNPNEKKFWQKLK